MLPRDLLIRVVVIPFGNILGVSLLLLLLSPALITMNIGGEYGKWTAVLLPLAALAVLAIDVRTRLRRPPDIGPVARWLSPFEGGSCFFIPSWLMGAAMAGFFLVALVVAAVRRVG